MLVLLLPFVCFLHGEIGAAAEFLKRVHLVILDDYHNLKVTENSQLVCLFNQVASALILLALLIDVVKFLDVILE